MTRLPAAPAPVSIYTRFSTDRQDARSIEDQTRRCQAFADARGFHVVSVYRDAAQSGAHLDRADMQRMLGEAKRRGGSPFEFVLVDDLSRLSRDLGNTWRLVFEDLASVNVKVIDVTTGMASDAAGARLTFGAMALVNDTFLQLVRTETHRGLEGRALKGFSTGGRVYGYATRTEEAPPDPEHPRKVFVIDPAEAEVVRRIFRLYVDGEGLKDIAAQLNREHIPAPYDGHGVKVRGHGWSHTTVRAMLRNERYLGKFVWNRRKFVRAPGKKNRRAIERPEAEWVTHEAPELAIIPAELWQSAQARFTQERPHQSDPGRPRGASRHPYLLSALLRCGVCNGKMTVTGSRVRDGVRYASFGCATHNSRGEAICPNGLSVSERKVNHAVICALRDVLTTPGLIRRFVERFNERAADLRASASATPMTDLERDVQERQHRVRNVTQALASVGWSEALIAQLKDEEAQLQTAQARLTALKASTDPLRALPPPHVVEGYLADLLGTLEADPVKGRQLLALHLGSILLTPKNEGPDRFYQATGALNLRVSVKPSCGGRI